MVDLAILLKLGTKGDSIIVRKGASGDHINSGLEIFWKGPSRDRKRLQGTQGERDLRGKEESEWTAEGAAGECPDVARIARAVADKDPSKDLAAHRASTQTPCSSPNRGGSSTRRRLHRLPGDATTDNAVGLRAEPRRARKI